MPTLRGINLNLLPVLREIVRKRNLTQAAQALNMSQPAVSESLSRLRHVFDDALLIPEGRGYRVSSLARRIQEVLEPSLAQIERMLMLSDSEELNISDEAGPIRISTADSVVQTFGSEILEDIREIAPALSINFLNYSSNSIQEMLRGEIDFILAPPLTVDDRGVERMLLYEDEFACIVPVDSPVGERLSEEEFWGARHAVYAPLNEIDATLRSTWLQKWGRHEFDAVAVQNMMLLPSVVAAANAIALVPLGFARSVTNLAPIRIVAPPFAMPPIRVHAHWHSSKLHDPLHKWMRQLMARHASLEGDSEHRDQQT